MGLRVGGPGWRRGAALPAPVDAVAYGASSERRSCATVRLGGQGMLRIPVESNASRTASAWAEVDLGAVADNVRALLARLPEGCRLTAVVKSDAYGHGMVPVARAALQAGAEELVVANVREGARLRAAGIRAPILIAAPILTEDAPAVVQHGLVAAVGSYETARALARSTRRYLPIQIEVDTGMTRHGVTADSLPQFVRSIEDLGRLAIAGVFTHFAGLEAAAAPELRGQLQRFLAAVEGVRSLRGVRRHACNTLGAIVLPEGALDAVRVGGGLLGFDPLRGAGAVRLRPTMSLKAKVVGLRSAEVGDRIGYGGAFVCQRPTRIALLPIGYGDGLSRGLWRGAEVLVRGRRAPIVGAISMNQTTVDVTDIPGVVFEEEVVLLGSVAGDVLRPEDLAPADVSPYEVTTALGPSIQRVYIQPGRQAPERWAQQRRP